MAKYIIDGIEFDSAESAAEYIIPDDYFDDSEFDDLLDEDGNVEICGIHFSRSRILQELDNIAYNCALDEWRDDALYERRQETIAELEDLPIDEEGYFVDGYNVIHKPDCDESNIEDILTNLFG